MPRGKQKKYAVVPSEIKSVRNEIMGEDGVKDVKRNDVIEITKSEMKQMLERINRLEMAADKSRLAVYDERMKKVTARKASLTSYEGKIVVGWKMIEDIVEKLPTGIWVEKQILELRFLDETSLVVPYQTFVSRYKKIDCLIKSEKIDDQDQKTYTVELIDGRLLEIGEQFIN
jgi:hypothetical protein